MDKIIFYLAILFVISVSCSKKDVVNQHIISEVEGLVTNDERRFFLEEIQQENWKIRKHITDIEMVYGYDSKERKEAFQLMLQTNKINLQKIELYLSRYGHPSAAIHGDLAAKTPYIVIHHSGNLASKERNFEHLYRAYKQGDLGPSNFSVFLGRYYTTKFDKQYNLP
ncbi:hypothetical protein [uncultured Aquimarina sp.]|uniref:hypothetical protein n=1 Tax=uncultured Aquimarina sp. TaxID=575652 RepID=UPI002636EC2D|nr:hypothetical protein [uncultured Aquimarina sp.]